MSARHDIDLTDGQFYAHAFGHPRRAYEWMRASRGRRKEELDGRDMLATHLT